MFGNFEYLESSSLKEEKFIIENMKKKIFSVFNSHLKTKIIYFIILECENKEPLLNIKKFILTKRQKVIHIKVKLFHHEFVNCF